MTKVITYEELIDEVNRQSEILLEHYLFPDKVYLGKEEIAILYAKFPNFDIKRLQLNLLNAHLIIKSHLDSVILVTHGP